MACALRAKARVSYTKLARVWFQKKTAMMRSAVPGRLAGHGLAV